MDDHTRGEFNQICDDKTQMNMGIILDFHQKIHQALLLGYVLLIGIIQ